MTPDYLFKAGSAFDQAANSAQPDPRGIDPAAAFERLTEWIRDLAITRQMPGVLVGISGTDSIVTFLAAAKAYERLGEPDRVFGLHYGMAEKSWIARDVFPWLRQHAPEARLEIDSSIDMNDDYHRWAGLFSRAVLDPTNTRAVPLEDKYQYWVADTRNATEERLGTYSNLTRAASLQPLVGFWKSEILTISRHLGVPAKAIEKSCEADCACGRLDLPAKHIPEVDALLMAREGLVEAGLPDRLMEPALRRQLDAFIERQQRDAAFKKDIPYRPPVTSPLLLSATQEWQP